MSEPAAASRAAVDARAPTHAKSPWIQEGLSMCLASLGLQWPPRPTALWFVLLTSIYLLLHAAAIALLPTRGSAAIIGRYVVEELLCGASDPRAAGASAAAACAADWREAVGVAADAAPPAAAAWVGSGLGEVTVGYAVLLAQYVVVTLVMLTLPVWSCLRCCGKLSYFCSLGLILTPLVLLLVIPVGVWKAALIASFVNPELRGNMELQTSIDVNHGGNSGVQLQVSMPKDDFPFGTAHVGDDSFPSIIPFLREGYYLALASMQNVTSNRGALNVGDYTNDNVNNKEEPETCAAGEDGGTCKAGKTRAEEIKRIFKEAQINGPDLQLMCLLERELNCRGFSDDDCPPYVIEGECATGERAVPDGYAPCRCYRCPLVVGVDKPRGCATALAERGAASLDALKQTQLRVKAFAFAVEAGWLLFVLLLLTFVVVCLT